MEADWARKMHAQLCSAKHSFPRVASHFVFRLKNFAFIYAMESASLHLSQLKVPAKFPEQAVGQLLKDGLCASRLWQQGCGKGA